MSAPVDFELSERERRWGAAIGTEHGESCVPAEDLLQYVEGTLHPKRNLAVIRHVGHCQGCREVVLELRAAELAKSRKRIAWPFARPSFLADEKKGTAPRGGWRPVAGLGIALATCALAGVFLLTRNGTDPTIPASNQGELVATNEIPRNGPDTKPKKSSSGAPPPNQNRGAKSTPPVHHSGHPKGVSPASPPEPIQPEVATSEHAGGIVKVGSPIDGGSDGGGFAGASHAYLVGRRGVYDINLPDPNADWRKDVEETYADKVVSAEATYKKEVAENQDPDEAQNELNRELSAAADERDAALDTRYRRDEDAPSAHPEIIPESDGPYEVVQIDSRPDHTGTVVPHFIIQLPWPGYAPDDRKAFGWVYNRPYTLDQWRSAHGEWRRRWVERDRPAFYYLNAHSGVVRDTIVHRSESGGSFATVGTIRRSPVAPHRSDNLAARRGHLRSHPRSSSTSGQAVEQGTEHSSWSPPKAAPGSPSSGASGHGDIPRPQIHSNSDLGQAADSKPDRDRGAGVTEPGDRAFPAPPLSVGGFGNRDQASHPRFSGRVESTGGPFGPRSRAGSWNSLTDRRTGSLRSNPTVSRRSFGGHGQPSGTGRSFGGGTSGGFGRPSTERYPGTGAPGGFGRPSAGRYLGPRTSGGLGRPSDAGSSYGRPGGSPRH